MRQNKSGIFYLFLLNDRDFGFKIRCALLFLFHDNKMFREYVFYDFGIDFADHDDILSAMTLTERRLNGQETL